MQVGIPAMTLDMPAAAGLGSRGVPGRREGSGDGDRVGAPAAPAVRAAALPRPGVSSSTPAAACCTAVPYSALAGGGGPPTALSAKPVPAVQRSDLAA
jgi:hypothetical protein